MALLQENDPAGKIFTMAGSFHTSVLKCSSIPGIKNHALPAAGLLCRTGALLNDRPHPASLVHKLTWR
jgi:hypothetical protein